MQFKLKNLALSLLCASAAQSIAATDPVPADSVRKYTDWLCSTMNSADLADYPRQYWEENVACALRAREELPWGKAGSPMGISIPHVRFSTANWLRASRG